MNQRVGNSRLDAARGSWLDGKGSPLFRLSTGDAEIKAEGGVVKADSLQQFVRWVKEYSSSSFTRWSQE